MSPLEAIACFILALVTALLVVLLKRQIISARFETRWEAGQMELLRTKIEAAKIARERAWESAAPWNGWRKFRVSKKIFESDDVCSFYLVPHDRKPLPAFQPGQYLTFQLDGIPNQTKPVVRCYSLSDCYNPDYYRISVKRIPPPRDHPDAPSGVGSFFLHDHVKKRALLDVGAPNGNFTIDVAESTPLVLIGGGIGMTPILSMLNAILKSGSAREVWFFYGIRNLSENILVEKTEELKEYSSREPNFHFTICYSGKIGDETILKPWERSNTRVTIDLLKEMLPSSNYQFYTCGPGPMMQAIKEGLRSWGVPAGSINEELFPGPKVGGARSNGGLEIKVKFRKAGKSTISPGGCASILELAEANGIDIPFGCKVGSCGTCVTAVLSGEVEYSQAPSWKNESLLKDEGLCLPCICLAKSKLVLDR